MEITYIDIVVQLAALVAAGGWVLYQNKLLRQKQQELNAAVARLVYLQNVLTDVAKGKADVWVENGVVYGRRKTGTDRPPQIH